MCCALIQCFERLRQECPSSLNKLVVVDGDLREKKLGLESGDYERLASDVSMVFHTAADVRFNQSLRFVFQSVPPITVSDNLKARGVTGPQYLVSTHQPIRLQH